MSKSDDGAQIEAGELTIRSRHDGETQIVEVFGELDLDSADALERELRVAEARQAGLTLLDLSGLEFMDSTGIRVLVQAAERARANGSRLRLLRGSGQVAKVMQLTGLDRSLPFVD